jgi:hypothetical protein
MRISTVVTLLLAAVIFLGCAVPPPATQDTTPIQLQGSYRGTYWITLNDGSSEQSRESGEVTMTFEGGHYEVKGDQIDLPPEGSGNYTVNGDMLELEDTARHTADFDWSLILSGRFQIDAGDDGYLRLEQRDLDHSRHHELELRKLN